jgi:hypothetical protein
MPGQHFSNFGKIARSIVALAREHPANQASELRRNAGHALLDRNNAAAKHLRHELRDVRAIEGASPREALVQDDPKGPYVCARVDVLLPRELLGRHVPRSPQDRSRSRERTGLRLVAFLCR